MATPHSRSNSNNALSTGPSRTLLQQLLEEINGAPSTRTGRNNSPPLSSLPSPPSIGSRSSSQVSSPSIWVGGSTLAQDTRGKLRAADEARRQKAAAHAVDGAPDLQTPRLCLDTSRLDKQGTNLDNVHGRHAPTRTQQAPNPVKHPHEYEKYVLKGSPSLRNARPAPGMQGHGDLSLPYADLFDDTIESPLSPLIFSDVYFDDDSSPLSPQTENPISPTDAPTSAATVYTAEELRTPTGDHAAQRTHFVHESFANASAQKRRTMTVPNLRSVGYFEMAVEAPHHSIRVGGDNRCLFRHETFTERAPTPHTSNCTTIGDTLPELSSFRPTDADPQGQPSTVPPSNKAACRFSNFAQPADSAAPDTPAWMRSMHLVDTGGKFIYRNVHDDGPIRHALCLWCFRTRGKFCKVHSYGYESCGRKEVLDSHYWEDDNWPEDSSDESDDPDN